jgi:hypothetical protein
MSPDAAGTCNSSPYFSAETERWLHDMRRVVERGIQVNYEESSRQRQCRMKIRAEHIAKVPCHYEYEITETDAAVLRCCCQAAKYGDAAGHTVRVRS